MIATQNDKLRAIRPAIITGILVVLTSILVFMTLAYEVEGEKKENLPFYIKEMSVVSAVGGIVDKEAENTVISREIVQYNDVFLEITDNTLIEGVISKISIENFNIINQPQIGKISINKITTDQGGNNNFSKEELGHIEFKGEQTTNIQAGTIGNNGGLIGFRILNSEILDYMAEENEITYNWELFDKINIDPKNLEFKMEFDIIYEMVDGKTYQNTIQLELPYISEEKTTVEIEKFQNFVYKR